MFVNTWSEVEMWWAVVLTPTGLAVLRLASWWDTETLDYTMSSDWGCWITAKYSSA